MLPPTAHDIHTARMIPNEEYRPSPEALLDRALREEHSRGGRLKVFLGAAPGVGKTYTMLEAAQLQKRKGIDVVVGIVETHNRTETEELLEGLETIPRRSIEYRGRQMEEMDLDAIIARTPRLVLVDELAHTNVPGSRHLKRYLDVEELLNAGIDVYTTVNIQHLDSLNDVVAQITGIRVQETIPDRIMERADDVELVDLPVEELLLRLREGKVYIPERVEQAIKNYFRPGNLTALRQLSLRHVAQRVDEQMQSYMQAHAIPGPWSATERLMVSIGPSPLSSRLVRTTRRMAERRHAEWIAIYVETPRHYQLPAADRDRVANTLRLAEELGGQAVTVPGGDVATELIRYAQIHNVTEIVVGKSLRSRLFELLNGSIVKDLIRNSGDVDIYVIAANREESSREEPAPVSTSPNNIFNQYLGSTLLVAASAVVAEVLKTFLSLPNLSMVFLLGVLSSAVIWGLRASIYASLLSLLCYDVFFVPPLLTFTINRPEDVLALAAYLVVAILTSNLTGRARDQAEAARRGETRTAALYSLSREIASAGGLAEVLQAAVQQIAKNLNASVVVLLPEGNMLVQMVAQPNDIELTEAERAAANWAWEHNRPAGRGASTLPGEQWYYQPLSTARRSVGVLALRFEGTSIVIDPDRRRLLDAMAGQTAVAIERARLSHDIEEAKLTSERERLYAILLSSISHDLRTPLASILGSATTLLENDMEYDKKTWSDLLNTIREEAERLNRFVGNLLDSTKLESGALRLNREWVELNDILGSARSRLTQALTSHEVKVDLGPEIPLLRLDFVLVEQVFINLLDNAAKYSSPESTIGIRARRRGEWVEVEIEDEGIGIPASDLTKVFDKFYRVQRGDRQMAGSGLGLSICRGIIEEHGGRINAASPAPSGKGTTFTILLPVEKEAPKIDRTDGTEPEFER